METLDQNLPYVQMFKCIAIGDVAVGKSCLLQQFMEQKFRSHLDHTIGVEFGSRIINIDNKLTKLNILDTAGQETFKSCTRSFYRGVAAAILVYDITRRDTFDHVGSWLKDAKEFGLANLTIILVGNKCDLSEKRAVSYEEGEGFAKEHGLIFMESSAKTNQNVKEAFYMAARTVSQKLEDGVIDISSPLLGGFKLPSRQSVNGGSGSGSCCFN